MKHGIESLMLTKRENIALNPVIRYWMVLHECCHKNYVPIWKYSTVVISEHVLLRGIVRTTTSGRADGISHQSDRRKDMVTRGRAPGDGIPLCWSKRQSKFWTSWYTRLSHECNSPASHETYQILLKCQFHRENLTTHWYWYMQAAGKKSCFFSSRPCALQPMESAT